MKKTVILILAVLPIVLLVVIAFAGQILSYYQHISVERVEFVDRFGTAYTADDTFTVEQGKTKATTIQIYPELASNKKVTYTSSDTSICEVDKDGVLHGIHYGSTTILVKSEDGSRTATLNVLVTADVPYSVTLTEKELSLAVGESHMLSALVDAPVAVDKSVVYETDNPGVVSVSADGKIIPLSVGEAIITVNTVLGDCTDTCRVVVTDGLPPLSFDLSDIEGIEYISVSDLYVSSSMTEIDLLKVLKVGEGVDASEVKFMIQSGSSYATITDSTLTLLYRGIVTVRAYVGDEYAPTKFTEFKITLKR